MACYIMTCIAGEWENTQVNEKGILELSREKHLFEDSAAAEAIEASKKYYSAQGRFKRITFKTIPTHALQLY